MRGYRFEATRTPTGSKEGRLEFTEPERPSEADSFSLTWSWNGGLPTTSTYNELNYAGPVKGVGKNYRSLPLP